MYPLDNIIFITIAAVLCSTEIWKKIVHAAAAVRIALAVAVAAATNNFVSVKG